MDAVSYNHLLVAQATQQIRQTQDTYRTLAIQGYVPPVVTIQCEGKSYALIRKPTGEIQWVPLDCKLK